MNNYKQYSSIQALMEAAPRNFGVNLRKKTWRRPELEKYITNQRINKIKKLPEVDPKNSHGIIKVIFLNKQAKADAQGHIEAKVDANEVAREMVDQETANNSETNASNFMTQFMSPSNRVSFKEAWKNLAAQQVLNGSFLEFQGMRFVTGTAKVYDAKRDNLNDGRDIFRHMLQQSSETRLYLKSKFKLSGLVNNDNTPVVRGGPTWADLTEHSKGKVDCEPDLIVRTPTELHIYELKMGWGKKEANTQPKEYHQLLRARRLFEKFMAEPEFANEPKPKIKLYFVGWSAPTDEAVIFGIPPWADDLPLERRVTKVNAEGLVNSGCPLNHQLVTKIVSMLNLQKAIAYYEALKKYFEPWGEGRPDLNRWVNSTLAKIKAESGNHRNAIEKPPERVVTRLQAKITAAKRAANVKAAATESKMRSMAGGVMRLAGTAAGAARGAASLMRSYLGSGGKTYARSSPNNVRFCTEAFSHGVRGGSRCQALLAATPSIRANTLNTLLLQSRGVPNHIVATVMSNRNHFDETYTKFVEQHGGPNTNAGRQLLNALNNPPSPSRKANFNAKKNIKNEVNNIAAGRALGAGR